MRAVQRLCRMAHPARPQCGVPHCQQRGRRRQGSGCGSRAGGRAHGLHHRGVGRHAWPHQVQRSSRHCDKARLAVACVGRATGGAPRLARRGLPSHSKASGTCERARPSVRRSPSPARGGMARPLGNCARRGTRHRGALAILGNAAIPGKRKPPAVEDRGFYVAPTGFEPALPP